MAPTIMQQPKKTKIIVRIIAPPIRLYFHPSILFSFASHANWLDVHELERINRLGDSLARAACPNSCDFIGLAVRVCPALIEAIRSGYGMSDSRKDQQKNQRQEKCSPMVSHSKWPSGIQTGCVYVIRILIAHYAEKYPRVGKNARRCVPPVPAVRRPRRKARKNGLQCPCGKATQISCRALLR